MKAGLSINPLLLSIMAQAAEIVKSETPLSYVNDGEAVVLPSHNVFVTEHTKILTLDPNILKHPIFNKSSRSNIHAYTFSKGLKGDGLDASNLEKLLHSEAVKIEWNPQWKNIPSWIVDFLVNPKRTSAVWMCVKYEDLPLLTEQWCHRSIQLGWAWWLEPPKTAGDLRAFFENSKNFWKFWFTHPKSDQWIFPWCNILLKQCATNAYQGTLSQRPWADARNKSVWMQLEEDAWQSLALVVGGENLLKSLSASVYEWVSENGIPPAKQ